MILIKEGEGKTEYFIKEILLYPYQYFLAEDAEKIAGEELEDEFGDLDSHKKQDNQIEQPEILVRQDLVDDEFHKIGSGERQQRKNYHAKGANQSLLLMAILN